MKTDLQLLKTSAHAIRAMFMHAKYTDLNVSLKKALEKHIATIQLMIDEPPSPSTEVENGWVKVMPKFDKDCILIVANYMSMGDWSCSYFEIKKLTAEDGWYWGVLQDGDEWGDLEDLHGQFYKIVMPPHP